MIDTDEDRRFDFFVSFDDTGKEIDFIATSGNTYEEVRPKNVSASPDLLALSAASKRTPSLKLLQKFESLPAKRSESWIASVALRNPSQHSESIMAEAFQLLCAGKLTRQCSFILTGFGDDSLKRLGTAMRETDDAEAARDAAQVLSAMGAAAMVCTADLVKTLEKDATTDITRLSLIIALLKISKESPDVLKPHLDTIRLFSSHSDDEIRRYAGFIVKQIEGAD